MATTDWPDSSGNGRGSSSFGGVTYQTAVQNGLPVCRFGNGFNNGMAFANSTNLLNALPFTIFIVYSYRASTSAGHRAMQGSNNWLIGPYSLKYSFYNNGFIDGPSTTQNLFKYVTVRQVTGTAEHWVNGVSQGTNSNNLTPGSLVFLGANSSDGSGAAEPLNGDIGEVLIYTDGLSTTDRQSVETYLAAKWAIT